MKQDEVWRNTAELIKRLIRRLPEMFFVALFVFASVSLWRETSHAKFAAAFVLRSSRELESIPLFQKLAFSVPTLLLVFFFTEDIIKVSMLNRVEETGEI